MTKTRQNLSKNVIVAYNRFFIAHVAVVMLHGYENDPSAL